MSRFQIIALTVVALTIGGAIAAALMPEIRSRHGVPTEDAISVTVPPTAIDNPADSGAVGMVPNNAPENPAEPSPAVVGRPSREDGWIRAIQLDRNQIQQIWAIRQKYRQEMLSHRQALQEIEAEFRAVMASDAPASAVREKHQKLTALRSQLGDLRFESLLATREVLTVEQRQQLVNLMSRRGRRRPDAPIPRRDRAPR